MLRLYPRGHRLWRCASGRPVLKLIGFESLEGFYVNSVCFHPEMNYPAVPKPKGVRNFRVDPRGISQEDVIVEKFKNVVAKRGTDIEKGDICVEAMRSISQLTPYSISNIFNCCKKGNFPHKELFELMVQWIRMCDESMIQGFSTIEITMTIQSIGVLAHTERRLNKARLEKFPDAAVHPVNNNFFPGCKEFVTDLLRECIRRDKLGDLDLDARGVADIVHGIGFWFHKKMGKPIDKPAVHVADIALRLLATDRVFEYCAPLDLSNVCFGLGCLEYADVPTLTQIMDRVNERLKGVTNDRMRGRNKWKCTIARQIDDSLDAQCISNIIWGLGKVKCFHEGALITLGRQIVHVLKEVDEESLANILYGYGVLGFDNSDIIQEISKEIGHPTRMMHYREMDLTNIVYSLALLDHHDEQTLKELAKEIKKPVRVGRFKEQEFSNIFHSLGKLNLNSKSTLDALSQGFLQASNIEISVQGMTAIITACGRLRYFNKDLMEKLCRSLIIRQNVAKLKETHYANIALSFARLKYFDAHVMDILTKPMFKKLSHGNFTPKDLSNLVYGLGSLGFSDERLSFWFVKILSKPKILAGLNSQGYCGVVYGLKQMEVYDKTLLAALRNDLTRKRRIDRLQEKEKEFVLSTLDKMDEEAAKLPEEEDMEILQNPFD